MGFGIVLKGLAGLAMGPAFVLLSNIVEYITSSKSGRDVALSLALAGFLDSITDLEDFGFENNLCESSDVQKSSLIVGKALLESGVEAFINNFDIYERPSGLNVAKVAVMNLNKSNIILESVWTKKSFNILDTHINYQDSPKIEIVGTKWISQLKYESKKYPTKWL
jgi:hypothetical protein